MATTPQNSATVAVPAPNSLAQVATSIAKQASVSQVAAKTAAPAKKPVTKKSTPKKLAVKPAAKPTTKSAAKTSAKKPVSVAKSKSVSKPQHKPVKKAAEKNKQKKIKMKRDSFTMPKDEYVQIDLLKKRLVSLGQPAKKSELLRAGVQLLAAMSDNTLKATLAKIPVIKTGRPKKK